MTFSQKQSLRGASSPFLFQRDQRTFCHLGYFTWRQKITIWWPGCPSVLSLWEQTADFLDYLSIPSQSLPTFLSSLVTPIQFSKPKSDIPNYRKPFLTAHFPPHHQPQPIYPNRGKKYPPLQYFEGTSTVVHFSWCNSLCDFSCM